MKDCFGRQGKRGAAEGAGQGVFQLADAAVITRDFGEGGGAKVAKALVVSQRLFRWAMLFKTSREDEGVFHCLATTLAEVGCCRMNGVAEECHASGAPVFIWLSIRGARP